jgi:hypothetical protein
MTTLRERFERSDAIYSDRSRSEQPIFALPLSPVAGFWLEYPPGAKQIL